MTGLSCGKTLAPARTQVAGILFILTVLFLTSTVQAAQLKIAVSANFRATLLELINSFIPKSGEPVQFIITPGSSGDLQKQAASDANVFDLFLSADTAYPQVLKENGKILEGSLTTYASGILVFWHGQQVHVEPDGIADYIESNQPRIATADPETAPYGKAAAQTLMSLGLYQILKDDNKLIIHDHVQEASDQIDDENAEAGFVSKSLVIHNEVGFTEVPEHLYERIVQQLVILKNTSEPELAREFAAHILSPESQQLIGNNGYEGVMTTSASRIQSSTPFMILFMLGSYLSAWLRL